MGYWLGFDRVTDPSAPHGFDVVRTVPKLRHLASVPRSLPNPALQFPLDASIRLLRATLASRPARQLWRLGRRR
jgi:hypothetical protein